MSDKESRGSNLRLVSARAPVNGRSAWMAGLAAVTRGKELPLEGGGSLTAVEADALRRNWGGWLKEACALPAEPVVAGYWVTASFVESVEKSGLPGLHPAGVTIEKAGPPHREPLCWAVEKEDELDGMMAEALAIWEQEDLERELASPAPVRKAGL